MMISIPDNQFFVWIQTPDGSVNINELFRVALVPEGHPIGDTKATGTEAILLFFKNNAVLSYSASDALYADLKDQLIRSNFLRVNAKGKEVRLVAPKPGQN